MLLVVEKFFLMGLLKKCGAFVQHLYVLFFTLISFVIFSVESMDKLLPFVGGLFGAGNGGLVDKATLYVFDSYLVLLLVCVVASTPLPKKLFEKFSKAGLCEKMLVVAEPVFIVLMLLFSTALLVDGSYNPFLYFRF